MPQQRKKHIPLNGFKGDTPPMKLEFEYRTLEDGAKVPVDTRRVEQERGEYVYHTTKGFRKKRQYNPHSVLNVLLQRVGLNSMYDY